jgi:hypothetical protein
MAVFNTFYFQPLQLIERRPSENPGQGAADNHGIHPGGTGTVPERGDTADEVYLSFFCPSFTTKLLKISDLKLVMYLDPQLQVYPFFPFHWHLSFL